MAIINYVGGVFNVNTTTAGIQFTPVVSPRGDGYVVVWNSNGDIAVQLYDQDDFRSGGEFVASTTNTQLEQFAPDVAQLQTGEMVITWAHAFSATDIDIRARLFLQDGTPIGNDFGIATTGTFDETLP